MFYTHPLLLKNNKLCVGFTTDLKERIEKHKHGAVKSTRSLRPLKLVHYEAYILEDDARRRERFLKTSEGRKFLNRQISTFLKLIGRYKNI